MTTARERQDAFRTTRRLQDLERQARQIPSRTAKRNDEPERRLLIIGGQVVSGVDCIQYAATVTPAAAYDPNVDAIYPAGLGRAWLIEDGLAVRRVLVRNALASWRVPLIAGQDPRATGTTTLTFTPGGGGDPQPLTAYLAGW